MATQGGGTWTYGNSPKTPIGEIVPNHLGANVGNPGVYPENCTDCTSLVGNPVCPGFGTNPTCQNARICNVQRPGADSGGAVTITLEAAVFVAPEPEEPGPLGPVTACAGVPTEAAADFFANIEDLQEADSDLVDHAVCPSFCRKAKQACTQVAQLARHCLDLERSFAERVSARACASADDPASCRHDLKQSGQQDEIDTRANLETARALCRGDVFADCLEPMRRVVGDSQASWWWTAARRVRRQILRSATSPRCGLFPRLSGRTSVTGNPICSSNDRRTETRALGQALMLHAGAHQ